MARPEVGSNWIPRKYRWETGRKDHRWTGLSVGVSVQAPEGLAPLLQRTQGQGPHLAFAPPPFPVSAGLGLVPWCPWDFCYPRQ